jgi:hypothetical protein
MLMHLPEEPYPGLRPFLDHESALMFGRDEQIAEVIKRLKELPFVAVIGGSGSGKSSLIRAGVIPELRNFAIPKEGDSWIPVVCTPGTNTPSNESQNRSSQSTPITRLASRFAKQLRPCDSVEADTKRLDEISRIFRQTRGFARLIDSYINELLIPPGSKAENARLLFVIDQFEELFHPTNAGMKDCDLLIERIIDHFFKHHPQCYVVLTMRSEHLNDCAAYLELPDAINKSFYLVRRLEEKQLRQAIVEPALLYLHLQQNQATETEDLPDSITFHPEVIARVLTDVQSITHEADHLPLLQHLLARLWQVARERSGTHQKVPASILPDDLDRAVAASPPDKIPPLDPNTNTLKACLENWAEAAYQRHNTTQQRQIDAVLRQLAFKDPNNGMYTQQRFNVNECSRILGTENTQKDLRALVWDSFIGSINYLFWDDDNPERPALKVSHESFIRGWFHFRQLIDEKAERFEEFLVILRKCSAWSIQGKPDSLLLEPSDLLRLRYANLEDISIDNVERENYLSVLARYHEGQRFAEVAPVLPKFLDASQRRQKKAEREARYAKRRKYTLGFSVFILVLFVAFYYKVQIPVTNASELFFTAFNKAVGVAFPTSYPEVDAAMPSLESLLEAAGKLEEGKGLQSEIKSIGWLPQVSERARYLDNFSRQTEPAVNGLLYRLMTNALWLGNNANDEAELIPTPKSQNGITCSFVSNSRERHSEDGLSGHLIIKEAPPGRMMFVPDKPGSISNDILLYSASYKGGTSKCMIGKILFSRPKKINPIILLDSSMHYILVSTLFADNKSTALYRLDWDGPEQDEGGNPLTVVTSDDTYDKVKEESAEDRVKILKTWTSAGGVTFGVSDQYWRLISESAQKLNTPVSSDWAPLVLAAPESTCQILKTKLPSQRYFNPEMYEDKDNTQCFQIKLGNPPYGHLKQSVDNLNVKLVLVAVYTKPTSDDLQRNDFTVSPITNLQFGYHNTKSIEWNLGESGPYKGWIAIKSDKSYFGVPYTTTALKVIANDVKNKGKK